MWCHPTCLVRLPSAPGEGGEPHILSTLPTSHAQVGFGHLTSDGMGTNPPLLLQQVQGVDLDPDRVRGAAGAADPGSGVQGTGERGPDGPTGP